MRGLSSPPNGRGTAVKDRLEVHLRRIADAKDKAAVIASLELNQAWPLARGLATDLEIIAREARALGEAVSVEAGDD